MDIDFEMTGVAALAVQQALIETLIERGALKPEDAQIIPAKAVAMIEKNPTTGRVVSTIKQFYNLP